MTKTEFDSLPSIVKVAIKASGIPIKHIELSGRTIAIPLVNPDKDDADEPDCDTCDIRDHCVIRIIDEAMSDRESADDMPDFAAKMFADIMEAIRDHDDGQGVNGEAAYDDLDDDTKKRMDELVRLGVNKTATLAPVIGCPDDVADAILSQHYGIDPATGKTLDDDDDTFAAAEEGDNAFVVPVQVAFIVRGADDAEHAARVVRNYIKRNYPNIPEAAVMDDPEEMYFAQLMLNNGMIPEDVVMATLEKTAKRESDED